MGCKGLVEGYVFCDVLFLCTEPAAEDDELRRFMSFWLVERCVCVNFGRRSYLACRHLCMEQKGNLRRPYKDEFYLAVFDCLCTTISIEHVEGFRSLTVAGRLATLTSYHKHTSTHRLLLGNRY